jgi:hypothetical protein
MKIGPSKIQRNPLIRLGSDERIQGNPRKTNPGLEGVQREKASAEINPNRA